MKKTLIWIIVILAIFWAWKNHFIGPEFKKNKNPDRQNQADSSPESQFTDNDISLNDSVPIDFHEPVGLHEDISIPIEYNEPVEFDGMSREHIMALRTRNIEAHKEFLRGRYRYSNNVFGQIQDGAPWWGIEGQRCYGPGKRSIEGRSEESRFILNPYLLLMLDNSTAYISKNPNCTPVLPGPPLFSILHPDENYLEIGYNMSRFLAERLNQHGFPYSKEISVVGLNARDFGYNFVYYDPLYSGGVSRIVDNSAFDDIQPIRDFIHRGRSCGYPNGCNNGSPYQPQIDFRVDFLPAYIYAKLWKNKPEDKNSPSDFNVKLILE